MIKFVVPLYLIILLGGWLWQDLSSPTSVILMRGVSGKFMLFQWISRATMIAVVLGTAFLVGKSWSKKK